MDKSEKITADRKELNCKFEVLLITVGLSFVVDYSLAVSVINSLYVRLTQLSERKILLERKSCETTHHKYLKLLVAKIQVIVII